MSVSKALGRDIIDFYENGFPEGYYYEPDEAEIPIHDDTGAWLLDKSKQYELRQLGTAVPHNSKRATLSFQELYEEWFDKQTVATITVRCPKLMAERVANLIVALDPEIEVLS